MTCVLCGVVGLGSCAQQESFELRFLLVDDRGCAQAGAATRGLPQGQYTLRLTFARRKPGFVGPASVRQHELVCDRVIPPGSGTEGRSTEMILPSPQGSRVSVRAEAFENGKLVYSGQREEVDLYGPPATIYLRKANAFSCAERARRVRAFHTATLLPNGQVLLLGGLVADATGGNILHLDTEEVHATSAVEVYDPVSLSFKVATGTVDPRAFHEAVLLPSRPQGPYLVLLLGGVEPGAPNGPVVRLRSKTPDYPFLFTPHESAKAASAALVTVELQGTEVKVHQTRVDGLPRMMFPVVAEASGDRILVVPGAGTYRPSGPDKGFDASGTAAYLLDLKGDGPPTVAGQAPLLQTRVGHGAVRLEGKRFLVLGGNMTGPEGTEVANAAELLVEGEASFRGMPLAAEHATAWHGLSPLGLTDRGAETDGAPAALWTGGFVLTKGETATFRYALGFGTLPPQRAVQFLRPEGPDLRLEEIGGDGFRLASYHHALRLHDGSVLVTGGNAPSDAEKQQEQAPCVGQTTPFCALKQVALYTYRPGSPPSVELRPGVPPLEVARYGHRAVRLLDNTVLVTGGVTLNKSAVPEVVTQAEIFSPRTGQASEDYPFERPAPPDPRASLRPCALHGDGSGG